MKRLSVRLSIVAAVIAIGGATIAYNIWKSEPQTPDGVDTIAKTDGQADDQQVQPIPDEEPPTVKPPAKSMFGDNTFRTVSHEETDKDDSSFPAAPDPYGGSPAPPPEPAALPPLGTGEASPVDDSDRGFPLPEDAADASPPAPAFGASLTDQGGYSPTATLVDHETEEAPGVAPAQPPASASLGDDVPEALPPGDVQEPPGSLPTGAAALPTDATAAGSGGFPVGKPDQPGLAEPPKPDTNTFNPGMRVASEPVDAAPLDNQFATQNRSNDSYSPAADPSSPIGSTAAEPSQGFPTKPPAGLPNAPASTLPDSPAAAAVTPAALNNTSGTGGFGSSPAAPSATARDMSASTGRRLEEQSSLYGEPADVAAATQSSDTPGDRQLEGQQMPALAIEKTAPVEVQVDREAVFETHIRNTGSVPADQVLLVDHVPQGTDFVDSTPRCTQGADGMLIWQLGTIEPGQQVTITTKLLPKVEGEIGSVAQVAFQTRASVRTVCTRPELKIEQTSAPQVLIGQNVTLEITISNVGSGVASGVVLENDVPAGFTHPAGRELEQAIGDLQPGQQTHVQLTLTAAEAGTFANRIVVHTDGNVAAQDAHDLEVVAPELQIAVNGPSRRYLDRPAVYTVELANPGTASATNVELVTYLPKGMKYVTSDNQGQYDSQSHAVYWSLTELPAKKKGGVSVTTLPIEPGEQKLRVDGKADLGLGQTYEHAVAVEGRAELVFTIADLADPIEVGAECSYEIRIQNRGSRSDSNVRLAAEIPPGMTFVDGDGPTQVSSQGQIAVFEPLSEIRPDEEVAYRIRVQGSANGDHVLRVQVQSDELRVPVTKEEITRVYSDK